MKPARQLDIAMTQEAWDLFDTYLDFMKKRHQKVRLEGKLAGAIVEFFLLAMGDDIVKGREEIDLDVFRRKFSKVKTIIKRRSLAVPLELLAADPKDRRSPSPFSDRDGAGGEEPEHKQLKIPWPV